MRGAMNHNEIIQTVNAISRSETLTPRQQEISRKRIPPAEILRPGPLSQEQVGFGREYAATHGLLRE